ncbi:hypothetical protein E2C01_005007 [Portunus trituberculatus]|uniref:Uncharacterized protein n=1 Tax=Portunus trituberculatus TaxID=210409 RepID=A0A5B7CRH8_PORTR|nr:hypothetical protein [Portunus trituberculatus]
MRGGDSTNILVYITASKGNIWHDHIGSRRHPKVMVIGIELLVMLDDEQVTSSALVSPPLPQNHSVSLPSSIDPPPVISNKPSTSICSSPPSTSPLCLIPLSSKKTGDMAVVDDFSKRALELQQMQMRVEVAKLVSEKAKTGAFLVMAAFFKRLDGKLNAS